MLFDQHLPDFSFLQSSTCLRMIFSFVDFLEMLFQDENPFPAIPLFVVDMLSSGW